MMMRMIVTLMVIMMMRIPYLFQKGATRHFGFHFQQRLEQDQFFLSLSALLNQQRLELDQILDFTFSKGWNWVKVWISFSAKVGIGPMFRFHFQQKLELG